MAELLSAQGFKSGATVGAFVLDSKWGLDQGFATYQDDFDLTKVKAVSLSSVRRPGNEVVDLALKWMDGVAGQRFFSWLHLLRSPRAHTSPRSPIRANSGPSLSRRGRLHRCTGRTGPDLSRRPWPFRAHDRHRDRGPRGGPGQHGEETHGFFIYESSMHVPLIMHAPSPNDGSPRVAARADRGHSADGAGPAADGRPDRWPASVWRLSWPVLASWRTSRVEPSLTVTPKRCIRSITTAGANSRHPFRPIQIDRRAAAGTLRPGTGSEGTDEHLRGAPVGGRRDAAQST